MKAKVIGLLAVAMVLMLMGQAWSFPLDLSFAPAVDYGAGTGPNSVAVGDFNRDGKLDLAVANISSYNVSILLGNGDGTFAAKVDYGVGVSPTSVAVGDFNGDGKLDLAVANLNSNSVSILLGNGNGSFQTAVSYGVGTYPLSVTVGDFNGDGKLDLAVGNGGAASSVSILLGVGNGTFQAKVDYGTGSVPYCVTVGDFNGDGKLDLATANEGNNNVSILLGNGNGTFQAKVDYGAGTLPLSVTVGDFNGDGKLDLAVGNSSPATTVSILLGIGDGTFAAAVNYPVGSYPWSVAVGDFNGDGKLDLATPSNINPGTVSILLGNGNGTFQAKVDYETGTHPSSVAVGDFNGDGKPDLAVANGNSDTVSILINTTDFTRSGHFLPAVNYGAGSNPFSVAVDDFNHDGNLDLAVANYNSNNVSILLGNGNGTFQTAVNYEAGSYGNYPRFIAVGDFNDDGNLDLAVANFNYNISILIGNGDGTFQSAVDYWVGYYPDSVTVGDFNGDGHLDLAVAKQRGINNVSILLGNGDGTFQATVDYSAGIDPLSITVGDFNGDGKLDLAVANIGSNNVSIFLGNGNGTFQTAINYEVTASPRFVIVGDFNGDSKLDLAVTNQSGSSNNISILLGNGDGTFQAAVNYGTGNAPRSMAVGDFNRDGKPDLVVTNYGSNNVSILLGNGDGTFQAAINYGVGTWPYSVVVGDFNHDEKPDLAVANEGSNNVSILLNTSYYVITADAGDGGTISPSGATKVIPNGSQIYAITPNPGYHVAEVWVDGVSVGAVTSHNFTNVEDDHDIVASFALNYSVVSLLTPLGEEIISSGFVYPIEWRAPSSATKFNLWYSYDNGTTWKAIATGVPGYSHNWTVPAPWNNRKQCRVRVVGFSNTDVKIGADASRNFTVEVLKLTAPNGGETWYSGTPYNITWNTNTTKATVAKVILSYTKDGGLTWYRIGTLTSNNGTYPWTPTVAAIRSNCKVKVVLKDLAGNIIGSDVSDAKFTLSLP